MIDPRIELAMFYLRQIKENVKEGVLSEKEEDFIYKIYEFEKMKDGKCNLSKREYDWLARIHKKCIERK